MKPHRQQADHEATVAPPRAVRACPASFLTSASSSMLETPSSSRLALETTAGDRIFRSPVFPLPRCGRSESTELLVVVVVGGVWGRVTVTLPAPSPPTFPPCGRPSLMIPEVCFEPAASIRPEVAPAPPAPPISPLQLSPKSTPPTSSSLFRLGTWLPPPALVTSEIKGVVAASLERLFGGGIVASAALGEAPAATTPRRSLSPDMRT